MTFSDIDWALTNLYWSQVLMDNRLGFVVGHVDVTDYMDVYGLINIWTDFNNYAFATNPTIPAPDQGLGAAVRFMFTDNYYILGSIADANGHPTEPGELFDSFFDDAEFFTHLEIGWIGAGTKANVMADFIAYSKSKGAYAGLNLEGSVVGVRESLNKAYYGKEVSPVQIIVEKKASNEGSSELRAALKTAAK